MCKTGHTYLAVVPVAHLILENLLFLCLQSLANAQPAAAYSASDVANATLLGELASDILVGPTLLLEIHNAGVVGIVVGFDRLGASSLAARDADVTLICETVATVGPAGDSSLLRGVRCQEATGDGSSNPKVKMLEGVVRTGSSESAAIPQFLVAIMFSRSILSAIVQ